MPSSFRTRIAPTPSGFPHTGNACNFLLTEKIARDAGGSLRLRIDDLDTPRIRPEYVQDIFESLAWLGIQPDEGPKNPADHEAHFTQQLRIASYEALLEKLAETGTVFACTCSRKNILAASPDGQYPGACRHKNLPLNTPDAAWRIITPRDAIVTWKDAIAGMQHIALYDAIRDPVVRRRDGLPAYHIASLADDAAYSVNTIVRGEDLLTSTAIQLYLASLTDMAAFNACRFYHHPLLLDGQGGKLSKSAGSTSLRAAREAGLTGASLRTIAEVWYKTFG